MVVMNAIEESDVVVAVDGQNKGVEQVEMLNGG
jgi:hypothetical protein